MKCSYPNGTWITIILYYSNNSKWSKFKYTRDNSILNMSILKILKFYDCEFYQNFNYTKLLNIFEQGIHFIRRESLYLLKNERESRRNERDVKKNQLYLYRSMISHRVAIVKLPVSQHNFVFTEVLSHLVILDLRSFRIFNNVWIYRVMSFSFISWRKRR